MKYLDVYLDDKLNWDRHIGYLIAKLSSTIAIFYKLRNFLPMNILITVYYSIVYSHLQYAVTGWGNCSITLRKRFQIKQNTIIRIINKCRIYPTKLKPLFEKMNLLNISAIYELEAGEFKAKLQNKELPDYFSRFQKNKPQRRKIGIKNEVKTFYFGDHIRTWTVTQKKGLHLVFQSACGPRVQQFSQIWPFV